MDDRMYRKPIVAVLCSLAILIGCGLQTAGLAQAQQEAGHQASPTAPNPAAKMLAAMPLIFEKNMGQAADGIGFLSYGDGYKLALKPDGAILSLRKDRTHTAVLRVDLQGADPAAQLTGVDEIRGKTNYLFGKDSSKWLTNVPNFQKVKVENALPGVDVLYYGSHRDLEYDFDVAPGADPGKLTLRFDGATALKIDPQGDLIAQTPAGPVRFRKPDAYQQNAAGSASPRTPVDVKYRIEDKDRVSFQVASYDHTQALVIDPTIVYATFWAGYNAAGRLGTGDVNPGPRILGFATVPGGASVDPEARRLHALTQTITPSGPTYYIYGIDEGNQLGDSSVDGVTASTTFTGCPSAGCVNIFVTEFDPSQSGAASLVYTTLIPAIAAEDYTNNFSDGLYYVNGYSYSSDSIESAPNAALAVDANGDAYFTGGTDNPDYPTTSSAYQAGCNLNPADTHGFCVPAMYVSELSPDGATLLYSTLMNSGAPVTVSEEGTLTTIIYPAFGQALAADNAGKVYVGGYAWWGFPNTNDSMCNVKTYTAAGETPEPYCGTAVAVKMDTTQTGSSSLIYSEAFDVWQPVVATDGAGNLYWAETGCTSNTAAVGIGVTQIPLNGYQTSAAPAGDSCDTLFELDLGGAVTYGTFFYAPGQEDVDMEVLGLAADSTGRAYVAGRINPYSTARTGLPIVNGFQSSNPSNTDAGYVAAFSTTQSGASSLVYSSVLEGIANLGFTAMATNGCGSVAVTGPSNATSFPLVNPLAGTGQPGSFGSNNNFILAMFNTYLTGTGSLTFSSALPGGQTPQYLTLDQQGNLAATGFTGYGDIAGGQTYNGGFPVTSNAYQTNATRGINASTGPNPILEVVGQAVLPGCLNIAPTTLAFGDVNIDNTDAVGNEVANSVSAAQQVVLTNTSQSTLTIDSIVPSTAFYESDDCDGSLNVGAACTINVTFEPTAVGAQTGTLTFTDSDVGSPQVVSLSGTGTAPPYPIAGVSPSSLTFSAQVEGTTSASQTVTLSNTTGGAALSIASIAATVGFGVATGANACGTSLAAGASCMIYVTFAPTTTGTLTGTLTVTDNSNDVTGSTQTVSLSGLGTLPAAQLSIAETLNVTDTLAPIALSTLLSIAETLNVTDGMLAATPSTLLNVAETVYFTDSPYIAPPGPAVSLSPTSLTFSPEIVGIPSPVQNIMLSNPGNAPLAISGFTVSGYFSQTNNCGNAVGAGGTCVISMTFNPRGTGLSTGVLSVWDNAPESPQTVALSGTGLVLTSGPITPVLPGPPGTVSPGTSGGSASPLVSLSASVVSFPAQILGTSSSAQTITLTNSGKGALALSAITLNGDFTAVNTCGAMVSPGASCAISVNFTPTAAGSRTGVLTISDNAVASPQMVQLSGTGIAAVKVGPGRAVPPSHPIDTQPGSSGAQNPQAVRFSSTLLTFESQTVGTTSGPQTVTLTNATNVPLEITSIIASGDFSQTNDCGPTLNAGEECKVTVTFKPQGTGAATGALTISEDPDGTPQTITLRGKGHASAKDNQGPTDPSRVSAPPQNPTP